MKEFSTSGSQEKSEHIYSEDPLTQSPLYERIDDFDMTKSKEIAVWISVYFFKNFIFGFE